MMGAELLHPAAVQWHRTRLESPGLARGSGRRQGGSIPELARNSDEESARSAALSSRNFTGTAENGRFAPVRFRIASALKAAPLPQSAQPYVHGMLEVWRIPRRSRS